MLFDRRVKPPLSERIRVALWPRRSWGRSLRYVGKRVLRLSATPHAIAAGFAAGAMVSFTPFVGFHFIMAGVFAFLLGGNVLASAFGTAFGNPLTFPFIWTLSYRVGRWILNDTGQHPAASHLGVDLRSQSLEVVWPVLKPMLVGAVPLGVITWIVFYFLIRSLVRSFQEARRRRLAEHAARKAAVVVPPVEHVGGE
ncbi:DUF2062 domain-containing protein [Microbaculum marinum]|uniref:DUF2062 domain-containing protein n=1 Tax=Microbaculum marinum TaxID=1764581 RepID=A0AAW9S1E1_9HYPH